MGGGGAEERVIKGSTEGQHRRRKEMFKEDYEQCGGFRSEIV